MGQLEPLRRTTASKMHEVRLVSHKHSAKLGTGKRESSMTMKRRFIIQQILETWVDQLPIDSQSGASIATKEDIARLSQELALRLGEVDERQTSHWLSILVELYTQARFRKQTAFYPSNNPPFHP
jgi:hypothetical protein